MSKRKSYYHESTEHSKDLVVPDVLDEFMNYKTKKVISTLLDCVRTIHTSYSNKSRTLWTRKDKKIIASLTVSKPFSCFDLFSIIKRLGDEICKDIKAVCRKENLTLEIPIHYFKRENNKSINPLSKKIEKKFRDVEEIFRLKRRMNPDDPKRPSDPKEAIKSLKKCMVREIPNKEHRTLLLRILEPMMVVDIGTFINASYESSGYNTSVTYNIKITNDNRINCNLIDYICTKESEIVQDFEIDVKNMKLKIIMKKKKRERSLKRGRRAGYHNYNKNFDRSKKKSRKEY